MCFLVPKRVRVMNRGEGELKVSFGYHCSNGGSNSGENSPESGTGIPRTSSFSCLSGAAISANATLANTNFIAGEILPALDSPTSFRKVPSLQSLAKLGSSPSSSGDFLSSAEVQVAGGAAGEDRVQAVCCEENGWLFCSIYDGFNGRDAADFLAGTLYETFLCSLGREAREEEGSAVMMLERLERALGRTEEEFLWMVEREMEERPDLVSIGSCVLVVLLFGEDLYTLNLGDSRAVLASTSTSHSNPRLRAVQLTQSHTADDEDERNRLLADHPDDPSTIFAGKVKGKLKVTRAFGVGYLKKKILNDALMGILRVQNLESPPYVSAQPSMNVHRINQETDRFVIVASDGLFDFLSNEEAVELVHSYIRRNPSGDPAKFLVERIVVKAANRAGFSMEELMEVPAGRRRKYHDDVTVIVIILGSNHRTTKASTCI